MLPNRSLTYNMRWRTTHPGNHFVYTSHQLYIRTVRKHQSRSCHCLLGKQRYIEPYYIVNIIFLTNITAVERALTSKLDDARDAIVNKVVDMLGVYKAHVLGSGPGSTPQLMAPSSMNLLPLMALCLIKHVRKDPIIDWISIISSRYFRTVCDKARKFLLTCDQML